MTDKLAGSFGFARLNSVLGVSTPPIPYCWSGNEVYLDSKRRLDEKAYLNAKLETLLARETVLAEASIRALFARVISANLNLIFDLHNCSPEMFEQYDSKLNLLLEAAFSHVENEVNVLVSKENIKASQQTEDGWMNVDSVNGLMSLSGKGRGRELDANKFVPKQRR
jgi:hypothetical protein